MIECRMGIILGYLMAIYTISSIYYLYVTNCTNIGTPFKDTLTEEQKMIKKKSAKIRGNIFYQGIAIGTIICLIFQPFRRCY